MSDLATRPVSIFYASEQSHCAYKKLFREFTSGDIGFIKTVVPVRLAQHGDDNLLSRSQTKRLFDRVDRFRTLIVDFDEVASIGQAFADEIFRVFKNGHPAIDLYAVNTNTDIQEMTNRAQNARVSVVGSANQPKMPISPE